MKGLLYIGLLQAASRGTKGNMGREDLAGEGRILDPDDSTKDGDLHWSHSLRGRRRDTKHGQPGQHVLQFRKTAAHGYWTAQIQVLKVTCKHSRHSSCSQPPLGLNVPLGEFGRTRLPALLAL
jgi:hypothetical protein